MAGETTGASGGPGPSGAAGSSGSAGARGTGAGGTAGVSVIVGPVPSAGCACAVDPGVGRPGALLLPVLGALIAVRRRRR
jgi:MYXO-CTERM domain-containing protein